MGVDSRACACVLWLVLALSGARAAAAQPSETSALRIPFVLQVYSRELSLGTFAAVIHPGLSLGVEYPRLRVGDFSFFPTLQLGFERHAGLQDRGWLGVAPAARWDPHPRFALQLSLGVSGVRLWSSMTPYHFDAGAQRWQAGESEAKWTWHFELGATAWLGVSDTLSFGLGYGFGVLFPFAPANDISTLPLTRLGLYARWVFRG
jgi:hypothetical protein